MAFALVKSGAFWAKEPTATKMEQMAARTFILNRIGCQGELQKLQRVTNPNGKRITNLDQSVTGKRLHLGKALGVASSGVGLLCASCKILMRTKDPFNAFF